ncbi:2-dehydropantoate 2-reductase [Streptomyces sp. NPDC089919]|uniref:2-dehydropantoate 2-reductase n=1 Tax=Streptomyces sp. NPDC089919 TaxID=3155188 RepID=UPI0034185B6E
MSGGKGPAVAVVGAGAVGGYFGGRLAAAGHDVRFLARGAGLEALRTDGLHVADGAGGWSVPAVRASDDPGELGPVDHVLLCVKTSQLAAALDGIGPLIGPATAVVTVQNGVEAPEQVAAALGRDRVLPGLVRVVAATEGPGRIRHVGPPGALAFAEWDSGTSERVERLRAALRDAGVGVPEPTDVRAELWGKFLLVAPIGSVGAATGATIGELRSRPGTRNLLIAGMREVYETALKLGIGLPADAVERAVELMDRQAPDATSSLQRDVLAGRPSELDAWTGAVVRLAGRAGLAAPVHETLLALLALHQEKAAR